MDTITESFFFQVMRIRKALYRRTTVLVTEAGVPLHMEQMSILITLLKRGTLSQRELADITLRDKSSIIRSISVLQKKGLLMVEHDNVDKRKNNVDLSPKGKELAVQIVKLKRKAENEVLSVLPKEEWEMAFRTVKNYADKLEGI
jgi:DNA-binding MarR family transcriptional regulator